MRYFLGVDVGNTKTHALVIDEDGQAVGFARGRPANHEAAGEALAREIQAHVKNRLAAHEYPREVEFIAELPMTTTGKIMRRELRQAEAEKMQKA